MAWDLARGLARLGFPVTFLTTRLPHGAGSFEEGGVQIVALEKTRPGRYSRSWWRESRRWFRTCPDDVGAVLSVSAGAYGLLSGRAEHPGVRFLMQAHGTSVGEILSKWRTRNAWLWIRSARNVAWLCLDLSAYGKFDRVVAVGPRVEEQLRGRPLRWFLPSERVLMVENGIDTDRFRPDRNSRAKIRASLGWGAEEQVVVTVSRLHAQKGIVEALRGFAEFLRRRRADDAPARYLIIGDGPDRERVAEEAARTLPPGSVRFVGAAERARIPDLLNASDLFLFTTLHLEGLPLNVLEAAAVGLPAVLSRTLRHGLDLPGPVRFVEPGRPAEIAEALGAISREARGGPSEAARQELPERYTLRSSASRYAEILFPGLTTGREKGTRR